MIIAHVITRLLRAGSEENTLISCLAQVRAGHTVYLIHGCDFDRTYYKSLDPRIKLIEARNLVHALSIWKDIAAFFEMKGVFKRLGIEVVHTHQSKAGIVGRFAAAAAGVRVVVHGIHIVPFENVKVVQRLIYLAAEKAAARVTHAFVSVSEGVKDLYLNESVGSTERHFVVHSGFELEKFSNAGMPLDWHDIVGKSNKKRPVVLMLAAFETRKRHKEFLSSVQNIVKITPDALFIFAGEGPQLSMIKNLVVELGLEKNTRFLGYRNDPERLIAAADICVLTSTREGLPRVIMQYLAGGKPVVVSRIPGIEEVVADGINGVIVGEDDWLGVESAVTELLACGEIREKFAAGARATDLSRWDRKKMGPKLSDIYEKAWNLHLQ